MQNHSRPNKDRAVFPRALVVGGDGVLATALRSLCSELGIDFVFTSRSSATHSGDKFLDLNNFPDKGYFSGFSTIIYLAQSRKYRSYPDGLGDLVQLNIIAASALASIAAQMGSKFVYCSTGSVYPFSDFPNSEESSIKSQGQLDGYVASKLFAEKAIERVSTDSLILRPFFIFGMSHNNQTLFPSIYKMLLDRQTINLKGVNGLKFNPISSHDAAAALLHLIANDATGVYNIAGQEVITLRDIADLIGSDLDIQPQFSIGGPQETLIGSCNKLLETGFVFSKSLSERLNDYILELKLSNSRLKSQ